MKPVLHIIGLGSDHLDKLSLEIYRVLTNAQVVYVWSSRHPAVSDMRQEGLPCVELLPGLPELDEIIDIGEWKLALGKLAMRIPRTQDNEQVVVALPGNPLQEGKIITDLELLLSDRFKVSTALLVGDSSLARLTGIMAELRSAWGCHWDREQTHDTLKKYLIEETYEVIEAIDTKDMNNFCEELGDLLLQVVFHSQLTKEANIFCLSDVIKGISDKLIRRHPHVFGSVVTESSEEVLANWDAIKRSEKAATKKAKPEPIDFYNIPKGLPALQSAEETQKKASKIGFDWDDYQEPLAKVHEELAELENEIGNSQGVEDELGDLLFSIVNLSRFLGVDAEGCLRQGTKKFQNRFSRMLIKIQDEKLLINELSLEEMDFYWNTAKNEEKYGTLGSF